MKKYLLIAVAALAATAFVSCNKDDEVKKEGGESTEYTGAVTLCMNEISGVKGYKGIEFYNYGNKDIDLKGWVVKKNNEVDGGTDADGLPTYLYWNCEVSITVKAKGFFVLHAKDNDANLPEVVEGGRATGGLSPKKALKLELIDPNGKVVDTFNRAWDDKADAPEITVSEVTGSYARTTDHGDNWAVLEPTFGATNAGATVVSATIPQE